ncbi:MAG: DUF4338 domain-containing protein [Desulfurivibrio sp.]|nr:MAG: DUF4338 domain-containing protein [Desulfurivibrio sp.]
MDTDLIIRGKRIRPAELRQIESVITEHWLQGRVAISKELCRLWDWRQENGQLKGQVCRILLRNLESKGLITLPPAKTGIANHPHRRYYVPPSKPPEVDDTPLEVNTVGDLAPVRLAMVRRTADEGLWNYLVHQYHYEGFRIIVGSHLKYIAWTGDRPIACLSWSSSVFRIGARDLFIGWNPAARSGNIRHVVNNSRFLILPWVRVKNLASHLLGRSSRVIGKDWEEFYGYPPYLLETFVDQGRFAGTCYKAANWTLVGETAGYAKKDNRFHEHGRKKDVLVLPLVRDFRKRLQYVHDGGGVQ